MQNKLKILLATSATVLIFGYSTANADSLTAVSWGGAYTKSQLEAYHKPFEKKTGIKMNSEAPRAYKFL